jgi:competence protein ComEC
LWGLKEMQWLRKNKYILGFVIFFFLLYGILDKGLQKNAQSEIHIIDLPNGDCTLIKTKEQNVLIGGGSENDSNKILEYLNTQKVEKLQDLIVIQPTKKYVNGLMPLLNKKQVERVYVPQVEYVDKSAESFFNEVHKKNIKIYEVEKKHRWKIDDITLEILSPIPDSIVPMKEKAISVKIILPKSTLLWLPESEEEVKMNLLLNAQELKADILKVSGKNREMFLEPSFLSYVQPQTVIIGGSSQVTEQEVRNIYNQNTNMEILSLDREGHIIFYRKGGEYYITSHKKMNIRIQ